MNKLSIEKKTQVITALVEGNSIRATCRMTGTAKGTVTRLLEAVGKACVEYQDKTLRNLTCKHVQCDEIWSFCYAKQKNVPGEKQGEFGYGDVWTFTAIDADTKLAPSWLVGLRNVECAYEFISDLKNRMANRIQLSTDGHKMYVEAVEHAFGRDIDYGMIVKLYGQTPETEKRYSPSECIGAEKHIIQGKPEGHRLTSD